MAVKRTSCLYETEPMYVEDQAQFLNGACEIETSLQPMDLLDRLQGIENTLGRVKLIDKGPRNIDLDILLYNAEVVDNDRLKIPHALMHEREFVLRPLCDIAPHLTPPRSQVSLSQSLAKLSASTPISTIAEIAPKLFIHAQDPRRPTHVMSILNVTPDSFSDGGKHEPTDVAELRSTILAHVRAGVTCIDIGGQSSRPGAPDISAQEEIDRILPAIEVIKSLPEAAHIAISIDTYRAAVAEAAIRAGAHMINDISAGLLDPEMLPVVGRLGCSICLMHMRGTPGTMSSKENCTYNDGLIETVGRELLERVEAAEEAGIRRWRIMLDPGVGFAKTVEQNVEILRRLSELRDYEGLRGMPWLLGTSRKGFIGKITGVREAKERAWGTAATVSASIQGGADMVRVHDAEVMMNVASMSDAIWRV
ncbi:hypothetical protein AAFC00_004650 [Neodothiora populina]